MLAARAAQGWQSHAATSILAVPRPQAAWRQLRAGKIHFHMSCARGALTDQQREPGCQTPSRQCARRQCSRDQGSQTAQPDRCRRLCVVPYGHGDASARGDHAGLLRSNSVRLSAAAGLASRSRQLTRATLSSKPTPPTRGKAAAAITAADLRGPRAYELRGHPNYLHRIRGGVYVGGFGCVARVCLQRGAMCLPWGRGTRERARGVRRHRRVQRIRVGVGWCTRLPHMTRPAPSPETPCRAMGCWTARPAGCTVLTGTANGGGSAVQPPLCERGDRTRQGQGPQLQHRLNAVKGWAAAGCAAETLSRLVRNT
jgi:hypothetical protein